jgi:hypothetical protein
MDDKKYREKTLIIWLKIKRKNVSLKRSLYLSLEIKQIWLEGVFDN